MTTSKTYFFMAGLPRSGSNLLSAILNENPEIYASPQTDLLNIIYTTEQNVLQGESYRLGHHKTSYDGLPFTLFDSFYATTDAKYVIDKNRAWSTPYNLNIAAKITQDVKIIAPVRNILDILSSYVRLMQTNAGNNLFDSQMLNANFYPVFYRDLNEARCDWLMSPHHDIERAILGLSTALHPEHKNKFHFVPYDRLIENPQLVMNGLYDFLGVDRFEHNFTNIRQNATGNSLEVFGLPKIHEVRPFITKQSHSRENVLSTYTINKYRNALDFVSYLWESQHK